jgi:CO dehydrogenase maturation factor
MSGHDHGPPVEPPAGGSRIVVTGKGGVGKTSLTALMARMLARRGVGVLAVDADPQMNLPYALGIPVAQGRALVPLSRNLDYVEEKTGARPGEGWGLLFRLNPVVDDVVARFGVIGPDGVRLLVMGTVVVPAAGCLCPENTLLNAVVGHVGLRNDEIILMDTQAGVEHFGRALARGFQQAVVLTDPTFSGTQVAVRTARLARDLGIPAIHLVVNRVAELSDVDRVSARLEDEGGFAFTTRSFLPFDRRLLDVEPSVGPLLDGSPSSFVEALEDLVEGVVHPKEVVG